MIKDTDLSAQFVPGVPALVGKALWSVAKILLKRKFCPKHRAYEAALLSYKDDKDEKAAENDAKALNQLKALFGALREVEAKIMQEDISMLQVARMLKLKHGGRKLNGGLNMQ